jgi:diketogulonate reductase-like aldo/keto reductase
LARGDKLLLKDEKLLEIGKKYSKTVAQVAIRWAFDQGFIVIPKSKHLDRVRLNFDVLDFSLTPE